MMQRRGVSGSVGITKPDAGVSVGFVGVLYREPDTDAGRCRQAQNDGRRDNMVKAIETAYKGYRFRSRLEARWAVFFDTLGWDWRYEHQGYQIGWGDTAPRYWLPDFELTPPNGGHYYVEVKGNKNYFSNDNFLIDIDFGGGPPGFYNRGIEGSQILLLGDVPEANYHFYFAPSLFHDSGVHIHWARLSERGIHHLGHNDQRWFIDNFGYTSMEYSIEKIKNFQIFARSPLENSRGIGKAFQRARSARFEHGERP
jgi:hypothetical protein